MTEKLLEQIETLPGPVRGLLWIAAGLYGGALALRGQAYARGLWRRHRLPCAVVSVGNLSVGGTGKTPLVAELARRLQAWGRRPAILIRGYRGRGRGERVVTDGRVVRLGVEDAGDEAVLLSRLLSGVPVVAGADRARAGRLAHAELGADVLLLDDGFQHLALVRDLDLVTVDAGRGFSNGRLLPLGPLRERLNALRRADAIVLTKISEGMAPGPLEAQIRRICPEAPLLHARLTPTELIPLSGVPPLDLERLRGMRVLAVCGIASPASFFSLLEACGARVVDRWAFPDHHRFRPAERARLVERARTVDLAVTTEKDAVRLGTLSAADGAWYALAIRLQVQEAEALDDLLAKCLSSGPCASSVNT